MRRALRMIVWLVEWWSILLLVLMVAVVVVGVFFRYVLDASLAWYDEFSSYLLVWLTFYGAVAVSAHRRHIGFETLAERLRPAARRTVLIAAELMVALFQAILTYYGWVALDAMAFDTAVSIPAVQMTWIYSALPISGALMFLISLTHLADLLGNRPIGSGLAGRRTAE